ncbi:MAG TPA: 50S ribosomal protein L11 methyltransferase, partial [Myxococcota bacterium]|nr:50S ribosomal protein L11 methyltransferase [Myxococcota bacterium]
MMAPKKKQQFVEYRLEPTSGAPQFAKPSQHRLMLQDFYRTLSFRNALLNAIKPGMTVLEIGTGTGILSHFAIEAGASHVFTMEASDFAGTARAILAHNGLAERVTVLEGYSFDLALPRRADLLVTEILGH